MDDPGSKLKQGKLSKHLISARQPKAHPAARFHPSVNRLSAALGHVQVEDDSNWDPLDHVILHLTLSLNPDKSWRKDADRRDFFVKLFIASLLMESLIHLALIRMANRVMRIPDGIIVNWTIAATYLVSCILLLYEVSIS